MTSDVQWQNYLDEATDAIHAGENVEKIRYRYGIAYKDDQRLIELIEQLDDNFPIIDPAPQFAHRLKDDLMGVERSGFVWRIRRLPARVQWAAIVAALLGGALFLGQRVSNASESLRPEERPHLSEES